MSILCLSRISFSSFIIHLKRDEVKLNTHLERMVDDTLQTNRIKEEKKMMVKSRPYSRKLLIITIRYDRTGH